MKKKIKNKVIEQCEELLTTYHDEVSEFNVEIKVFEDCQGIEMAEVKFTHKEKKETRIISDILCDEEGRIIQWSHPGSPGVIILENNRWVKKNR